MRLSWPLLAVLAFVALIHAAWWGIGDTIVAGGGLADGDSFTHLLRIQHLFQTGDWLDVRIPDLGGPTGTTVHWTRLFDMLLLALMAPLWATMERAEALYWAGALISPVLHLATAAAMVWAAAPLLGRGGAYLAGAITATQFGVLSFAIIGRADHHMMFALFAVLVIGYLFRSFTGRGGAFQAGFSLALGLWVGPEFLMFMTLAMTVTGLAWLAGADGAARRNLNLAAGLGFGLLIAVVVERGLLGVLEIQYDRASLVHVSMAVLIWLFWASVAALESRGRLPIGPARRTALAAAGALLVLAIMHLGFPKIFDNPLLDVDPAVIPIFGHIVEYAPIDGPALFLIHYGSILFAAPWLAWRLKGTWGSEAFWPWLFVAICTAVYFVIGVQWLRWTLYVGLFASLVIADLAVHVDGRIDARFTFPARTPIKVLALFALIVGPLVVGGGFRYGAKTPDERAAEATDHCPVHALTAALNAPPLGERTRTIVASANFGPEIVYRTDHRALASVQHRNADGIVAGYRILGDTDDTNIKTQMAAHGADTLVLCPETGNDAYFLMDESPEVLYRRLLVGDVPAWLKPVSLPGELREKFRVFEARQSPRR